MRPFTVVQYRGRIFMEGDHSITDLLHGNTHEQQRKNKDS